MYPALWSAIALEAGPSQIPFSVPQFKRSSFLLLTEKKALLEIHITPVRKATGGGEAQIEGGFGDESQSTEEGSISHIVQTDEAGCRFSVYGLYMFT